MLRNQCFDMFCEVMCVFLELILLEAEAHVAAVLCLTSKSVSDASSG